MKQRTTPQNTLTLCLLFVSSAVDFPEAPTFLVQSEAPAAYIRAWSSDASSATHFTFTAKEDERSSHDEEAHGGEAEQHR